ncbi:MAG: 3-hydroxyacyl-ACP dehydratase [Bacteroidia bacterium]|nr:3-hydroxyacyl-ACP dehydratase [Bacteroidia bacterium]
MLATKEDITRYIPQRPPMLMVHNLVEASDEAATTELYIDPANVFVNNGYLREPGLVENIAQTAAVHVGFMCAQQHKPVPIGYIAAIKSLRINALPKPDSIISTQISFVNKVMDVTVVEGQVTQGEHVLCKCEMRIFAKT